MKRLLKPATVLRQWAEFTGRKTKAMARKFAMKGGFRSMGEVECAADMDKRGIKYKYEAEKITYQVPAQKYTPDFILVDRPDLLIEYKGYMRVGVPKKMIAIKNSNPDRKVCIVFQNAKTKYSKTMNYGQWADKNCILWSHKTVKEEWLNEENI